MGRYWVLTAELRWVQERPKDGCAPVAPTLQQKWVDRYSGEEDWRDVPVVIERAEPTRSE